MSASESRGHGGAARGAQEPAHGTGRLSRARRRTFYSIGEVCALIGVKPHVLRYWESQFEELSPAKNRAGNRVYRSEEIELIALIHRLVHEERFTVAGARRQLGELREQDAAQDASAQALRRAFLRTLGAELRDLHDLLDPGETEPNPG
jgi:DNA-binding transcriptional MerR regulator